MPGTWSKVNTGTYLGTIGFAYLSFVMFILFFFGLVVFQSAVNEELGLRKLCPAQRSGIMLVEVTGQLRSMLAFWLWQCSHRTGSPDDLTGWQPALRVFLHFCMCGSDRRSADTART